jgi:cell division protein ZapB
MEADLISLEEKITKLITLCATLREENSRLRGDLTQTQQTTDALKSNMLLASNKLESLLESLPATNDAIGDAPMSNEPISEQIE